MMERDKEALRGRDAQHNVQELKKEKGKFTIIEETDRLHALNS